MFFSYEFLPPELFAFVYLYLQEQGNNLHRMLRKFLESLFLLAPQRKTQQTLSSQPEKKFRTENKLVNKPKQTKYRLKLKPNYCFLS